jgi:hypothetical protein
MTVDGISVWLGEVGRDIPARAKSSGRLVDADDARMMLFQDFLFSQTLGFVGAVKRGNAMAEVQTYADPLDGTFIADGIRYVLGLSSDPVALADVELMQWEAMSWR